MTGQDRGAAQSVSADATTHPRFHTGRRIKDTESICPVCLAPVNATVYTRHGQVWMDKTCAKHGPFSALLASDTRHYYESSRPAGKTTSCCASACGDSSENHSCNILIEITQRCNLSCPTCFAASTPQHGQQLGLQEFTRQVDALVRGGKNTADVIQLSGGEPTIHPQLFEMIEVLAERNFRKICINTNGIKLASEAYVERLATSHPGLSVYLQFDGFDPQTHRQLRGRSDFLKIKQAAIVNCMAYDIRVVPVMTLTRGINEHEVGDFLKLAIDNPAINNVVFQPAMYSGRYENTIDEERLTLADTVQLICQQSGVFTADDFSPIPCSDPNCFSVAVALRTRSGPLGVSRYFPRHETWNEAGNTELIAGLTDSLDGPKAFKRAIDWAASADHLAQLDDSEVDRLLDGLLEWQEEQHHTDSEFWGSLLVIGIKPFMDAYTYDQDRIDKCCVHILDPGGKPVSFCEYNAINRPQSTASQKPQIAVK